MKYTNPIHKGFYPDPSLIRVEDTYYLVNSSFEYLPGVPIHQSKDLIHWEPIGYCLTKASQIDIRNVPCSCGIFAPTLRYHKGTFYMITTNIGIGTFIVTTKDMKQSWSDPLLVDTDGYDPSLFFDEDDTAYIQITKSDEAGMGIFLAKIDVATGKLLDPPTLIWRGTGGRDPEGPHLFRRNNYYYLNIAEGGTREGHMITLARSKNIWGPYEACPYNPVLTNREEANNILQAIGHADYFTDKNGNWWVAALCIRTLPHYFHHLGRETILVPLTWDEEDWPHFGSDGNVYTQMEGPLIDLAAAPLITDTFDDFNSDTLHYQWNYLRDFINSKYSLTARPGWLQLIGSNITLNELSSPTFLARRQQEFDCTFRTMMEFLPININDEAGLSIFYDNEHHFELGVRLQEGKNILFIRKNVADLQVITDQLPLEDYSLNGNRIYLEIAATPAKYYFNYSLNGKTFHNLGYTYTKHLSTEATNSDFVGVYCGMYAVAGQQNDSAIAYFDWFSYSEG